MRLRKARSVGIQLDNGGWEEKRMVAVVVKALNFEWTSIKTGRDEQYNRPRVSRVYQGLHSI